MMLLSIAFPFLSLIWYDKMESEREESWKICQTDFLLFSILYPSLSLSVSSRLKEYTHVCAYNV